MSKQAIQLAAFFLALVIGNVAMAIEEPEYEVLAKTPAYELRRYEPYVVAEVDIQGRSADSQGFRTLAAYIFGDNHGGQKMAMTAPVESREAEDKDAITYGFVMERQYTLDSLPAPNNEDIRFRKKSARVVAVRRFSGRWSEKNIARHERDLLESLVSDNVEAVGAVELARYNGPFTPWFLRRNELIVPVQWPPLSP